MKRILNTARLSLLTVMVLLLVCGASLAALNEMPPVIIDDGLPPEVLTATATLSSVFIRDGWMFINLELPGGSITEVLVGDVCRFFDLQGSEMTPSDFADRYTGETVTIDFEDLDGFYRVIQCRAGRE